MSMNSFARSEVRLSMEDTVDGDLNGLELGDIEYSPRTPSGSEASDDVSYTRKNMPGEEEEGRRIR
jgi:hypothetical protein